MSNQSHHWSRAAEHYEREFIDPYRKGVKNPLLGVLKRIRDAKVKTVADLGCGIGPLLPFLAERFGTVHAVDFAPGMLARSTERCRGVKNLHFHERSLADLAPLHGEIEVALAINSLVMPDLRELEQVLREIHACLRPGGRFLGIVPSTDGLHYYTMLLLDRALAQGMPPEAAQKNAAHHAEHRYFDFAFSRFKYQGLEQHFWQPFEVRHRLRSAGFSDIRLKKVHLAWEQFALHEELSEHPAPWDWFFACRRR